MSRMAGKADGDSAVKRGMLTGVWLQGVLFVFTALLLDLGQLHRAFLVAMLCQLAAVLIIILRRRTEPTAFDLMIVRYGIVPLFLVVAIFGPVFLRLLGTPGG